MFALRPVFRMSDISAKRSFETASACGYLSNTLLICVSDVLQRLYPLVASIGLALRTASSVDDRLL